MEIMPLPTVPTKNKEILISNKLPQKKKDKQDNGEKLKVGHNAINVGAGECNNALTNCLKSQRSTRALEINKCSTKDWLEPLIKAPFNGKRTTNGIACMIVLW